MTAKLAAAFMALCAGSVAALIGFLYLDDGRSGIAIIWVCIAAVWLLFTAPMWIRMHLRDLGASYNRNEKDAEIGLLGLANLVWAGVRWLLRAGDWVWQNRPPTRRERAEAEALQAAIEARHAEERRHFEEWERSARAALGEHYDALVEWQLNLAAAFRTAAYDREQSELASAEVELRDDRLAETVRQWSRGAF